MSVAVRANRPLEEVDKATVLHPYTSLAHHLSTGPRIFIAGNGCRLRDSQGRDYIDGLAGLWCVNVGYGREEIVEAIARQARVLPYYHAFASTGTEPPIRLAERVLQLAPPGMSRVFFASSGSEANDTLIKLVWYYNNLRGRPRKKKIIARRRAYHGVTIAAGSLTGLPAVHGQFDLPIANILHVEPPYPYWGMRGEEDEDMFAERLAAELDRRIEEEGSETVAAFVAEPVMGAGGVIVPPRSYFPRVQEVLHKHDVLMMADEVICGFGRLGAMFGSEVFGIEPDLMAFAKGITSGYQPLSGCLVGERVWKVLVERSRDVGPFGHGFTYTAHPIPAAAALANLDIIEREELVENAANMGAYLHKRLAERIAPHPLVGEVRGLGLIAGIELVADRDQKIRFAPALGVAKRAYGHGLEAGLISRPLLDSDILALSPPLSVCEADIDEIIEKMGIALDATAATLEAEGLWPASGRGAAAS